MGGWFARFHTTNKLLQAPRLEAIQGPRFLGDLACFVPHLSAIAVFTYPQMFGGRGGMQSTALSKVLYGLK